MKVKPFPQEVNQGLSTLVLVALVVLALVGIPYIEAKVETQPWGENFTKRLEDSQFLEVISSVSIMSALIIYIQKGYREEKTRKHREAWKVIEDAESKEMSPSRIDAMQLLNRDNIPLREINAIKANLKKIYLEKADLMCSKLEGANLSEANLQEVKLDFAHLQRADLQLSILKDASLLDTNLAQANLAGADLRGVDFRGSDLHNANFLESNLEGADLRKTRNLKPDQIKQAKHWELAKYDEGFV
ncbi:MAG: pentapeptide repeat-containing protein [Symploca sp. SIO3C6]|uniref:Pentapeptide repeat-containing protein n=1 Tax=Symploca sp. SIO1C4 TaxID=2607765 RepID=A0A6B3NCU6_9CYAN|nr:pentapeptide repeat-containing protein [Symploca sp. SIO3C6]NER29410.1 pentapeptide repeat-containing protein [Symploca sp. SIO1C4]